MRRVQTTIGPWGNAQAGTGPRTPHRPASDYGPQLVIVAQGPVTIRSLKAACVRSEMESRAAPASKDQIGVGL